MNRSSDEYFDYSCSTAVERLARDVETVLRSWHVVDGSDRHVSMTTPSIFNRLAMIRSHQLVWELVMDQGGQRRVMHRVDLELTLWDGPPPHQALKTHDEDGLPYSLCRNERLEELPDDLFTSFSSLFGIGQHITLSPMQPNLLPDELLRALVDSIGDRHVEAVRAGIVQGILSSWLQTALNLAASACHCAFPLFGVWGHYQPILAATITGSTTFSSAVLSSTACPWRLESLSLPKPPHRRRRRHLARNECVLPLTLAGSLATEGCTAAFTCQIAPLPSSKLYLTQWAQVLLDQGVERAALWGARAVYAWFKPRKQARTSILFDDSIDEEDGNWRSIDDTVIDLSTDQGIVAEYDANCRSVATNLLAKALGATPNEPLWGPPDDPVASLHATITWNGLRNDQGQVDPLLTFPLKIRSRHMSKADWAEMQESVERMILDPHQPSKFELSVHYDSESAQASLTASQRCVLAALIRTATLPSETLCGHLIDGALIASWDNEGGNIVAGRLAEEARATPATLALVAAMDWDHVADDMIEEWQAEAIVEKVLDPNISREYPFLPTDALRNVSTKDENAKLMVLLNKAAPPARLLSLLCAHMARVRSPSSMALVWMTFVQELRRRWDAREFLPNMRPIAGLDLTRNKSAKKCASMQSIGTKAEAAGKLNNSEPDPDDSYCLIGQKLQVFNVCLECAVAAERRELEEVESKLDQMEPKRPRLNESDEMVPVETTLMQKSSDSREESSSQLVASTVTLASLMTGQSPVVAMDVASQGTASDDEFFDAEEGESERRDDPLPTIEETTAVLRQSTSFMTKDGERKGFRCPVQGAVLSNGEQLFAPYLQRPAPVTDDIAAERRLLIARQRGGKLTTSIAQRLEIAHRLVEPKLLSDMQAFKAANPGAVFQDFVSWYGNPSNPLDVYEETEETQSQDLRLGIKITSSDDSVEVSLDDSGRSSSSRRRMSRQNTSPPPSPGGTIRRFSLSVHGSSPPPSPGESRRRFSFSSLGSQPSSTGGSRLSLSGHGNASPGGSLHRFGLARRSGSGSPGSQRLRVPSNSPPRSPGGTRRRLSLSRHSGSESQLSSRPSMTNSDESPPTTSSGSRRRININLGRSRSKDSDDSSVGSKLRARLSQDETSSEAHSRSSRRRRRPSIQQVDAMTEAATRSKLDKAAEAIRALKETRDFWAKTWERARAVPASEQEQLFDTDTTVEMALDYFENLHPATLMCQVLAVNLASSFFVLSSAATPSMSITVVRAAVKNLREKIEAALQALSLDALTAVTVKHAGEPNSVPSTVATVEAISSCERACIALYETEVLVSRATSLLHKLRGDHELVEVILQCAEASAIVIEDGDARTAILQVMAAYQHRPHEMPEPLVREYLLRSYDSPLPRQLCVRYGSDRASDDRGVVALALGTCNRD